MLGVPHPAAPADSHSHAVQPGEVRGVPVRVATHAPEAPGEIPSSAAVPDGSPASASLRAGSDATPFSAAQQAVLGETPAAVSPQAAPGEAQGATHSAALETAATQAEAQAQDAIRYRAFSPPAPVATQDVNQASTQAAGPAHSGSAHSCMQAKSSTAPDDSPPFPLAAQQAPLHLSLRSPAAPQPLSADARRSPSHTNHDPNAPPVSAVVEPESEPYAGRRSLSAQSASARDESRRARRYRQCAARWEQFSPAQSSRQHTYREPPRDSPA